MWIMTKNGFLSVVDKSAVDDCLLVRARRRAHLKAVFPKADIRESFGTDYRYRADIPRSEVARVIAAQIEGIDYGNFKGAVREKTYHDALMGVWHEMASLQPGGPYARDTRNHRARRDYGDPDFFEDGF